MNYTMCKNQEIIIIIRKIGGKEIIRKKKDDLS